MENSFTIYLISTASMDIFPDNTISSFRNFLKEPLKLEGDWRVALSEITFPSNIKNVTDGTIYYYDGKNVSSNEATVLSKATIPEGEHKSVDRLLESIDMILPIYFDFRHDEPTGHVYLEMGKNQGITFVSREIPNILGFHGVADWAPDKVHIGYKCPNPITVAEDGTQYFRGDFPADITAGTQLLFVYTDIIDYQHLGDTKSPILSVIDANRRLKNGSLFHDRTLQRRPIQNYHYKKLLKSSIDSIKIELRTETGKLAPFLGTGKSVLVLHFKKFD